MNIGQIKFFTSAVELKSFSRVAKEQGVTVQAVSKAIINLERELGGDLFVRESRGGVSPTVFGQAFYEKACKALYCFEDLSGFAKSYFASPDEVVRLGLSSVPFPNYERTCAGLGAFLSKRLGAKVSMTLMSGESGLHALHAGEIDGLVSLGTALQEGLDRLPVGTVLPGVIFAADHPLAANGVVTVEQAAAYPLATSKELKGFNEMFVAMFTRKGISPVLYDVEDEGDFVRYLSERALVPCVALRDFAGDESVVTVRPVRSDSGELIPVTIDTLKDFKSPQYLKFESMFKALKEQGGFRIGSYVPTR